MRSIAKFSVNKAVTVFMAVILVGVFGVVSYTRLTTDLFPSMNIPYAVVVTTYVGASPDEIEEVISKPLEDVFSTTTNVKKVVSTSMENVSIITLEFESDTNMDSAMIEMRENIDLATADFPDLASNPMIMKINLDMMPVMVVSISKDNLSTLELTNYIDSEVLPSVERLPGVASVTLSGAYESEIRVILDDDAINDVNDQITFALYGANPENLVPPMLLDKDMISNILKAQNFSFPTGYIDVGGVDYLVRVGDEFTTLQEMKDLVIFDFNPMTLNPIPSDDLIFTLDELADVDFYAANDIAYSKVNGENAITLIVQKGSSYATTDVTESVMNVLNGIEDEDGVDVTVLLDQGEYINLSTGSVANNLLYGSLLAVIILFLFLRSFRATFIVGIAIPISLLFSIVLIYLSGITLNIVSLGGLALGIGMLVDNSIVVMENIFRMKKLGYSNKEAAIEGTTQVAGAITASTLTTISVFLPIMFIEGFIKEIFIQMALTIAFSLTASLMIALTLVPSIASKILIEEVVVDENKVTWLMKIQSGYKKTFKLAFRFKYIVLVMVLGLFASSILLAVGNGFEYFPVSDEGSLTLTIGNPTGDELSFDDFTDVLDRVNDTLTDMDDVETVGISLGGGSMMFLGMTDSSMATVNIILKSDRTSTTAEFEEILDDIMAEDYSEINYSISGTQMMTSSMTGSGIQLQISGYDLDVLKEEAIALASEMEQIEGVKEVSDGVGVPSKEIQITVDKDEAIKSGLTVAQVLMAVAEEISFEESISTLGINGDLYEVYVYDADSNYKDSTYTEEDINNIVVGQDMFSGNDILVSDVAIVNMDGEGYNTITRINNSRVMTVNVTVDPNYNTSIVAKSIDDFLEGYELPSGYSLEVLGENEQIMEAVNVLVLAVALAIVLIYMIMASQFQSLTYPFIIMFTIPLAFTGGFAILYIFNFPVSVVALIGLIILTGVVVNNGIVLVDYTNQLRNKGYSTMDALLEAGTTRLRPILMTALTTILALSTMAIGIGEGAEMMQPMALTTIGGLIYATLLTLIVVPIMYYLVTYHIRKLLGAFLALLTITATVYGFIAQGEYLYFLYGTITIIVILLVEIFVLKHDKIETVKEES